MSSPIAALAATALLLAGCGIGGTGQPTGHSTKSVMPVQVTADPKLAAMVPEQVAGDGTLLIANDQTYPPNEFRDNGALVGMEVDLGKALAARLGLRASFQNASFDGILGGIQAHKYDAAISSFGITPSRLQEVDLVSYYAAGTALGTLAGNPNHLTVHDLCGRTIAVQRGTTQLDDILARNEKCVRAGKPPSTVRQFQAQTDVNLALAAKRVQGELADSPVVDYAVKQTNGKVRTVGAKYANVPYGVAVPRDDHGMAAATRAGLQSLIDDGSYHRILAKWGLAQGAVDHAQINPTVTDSQ